MKASDVMTSPVLTVGPDTAVREIAGLMIDRRISAVPVVENGRVIGMVSEADLLHRHEIGTDATVRYGPWWLGLFDAAESPAEYVKAHASKARDVMARDPLTIAEDEPVASIAALLAKRETRRVVVMRGDKVVGIVTRADLVRALARSAEGRTPPNGDDAIRRVLVAELQRHPWWRALYSGVTVTQGVVHFYGLIESESERRAARIAAENVVGVHRVEDHRLTFYDSHSMI